MEYLALENQQKGLPAQAGVSLVITFFIMVIILAVVLSVSTLLYNEIKVIKNIGGSVVAFYAADSGIEKVLYYDRRVFPDLPDEKIAVRGVCSMCYDPVGSPDGCVQDPGPGSADKSIYCNSCQALPLDVDGFGCKADTCDNCKISFDTAFDNRDYSVIATVLPGEESTNFEIKSKGSFDNVVRQIDINSSKAITQEGAVNIENALLDKKSVARRETITFSADISTSIKNDIISKVFATIWDSDGNSENADLFCTGGPCFDPDNPDYSSGHWSGEWSTNKPDVYYASITAQDSKEPPNETTKNISNNPAGQAFEVYHSGETQYPTLTNANVSQPDSNSAVITADVYDISGVLSDSVIATIKEYPSGVVQSTETLHRIFDNSFATDVIDTTGYSGTYTVDISVKDNFFIDYTYIGATDFTVGPPGPDWLLGYAYRKEITVSNTNIGADLANFPILIHFSDADIGGHLQDKTTCNDIRFTDSNGTTLLKYEKESCSVAGGTATANFWVKITNIYHTPTGDQNKIYVYYGKASDSDDQDAENVWDSNYKAVYHLKEVVGNKWADSTSNKNDGDNHDAAAITGKVSGAGNFVASFDTMGMPTGDYIISKKSIGISGSSAFTVEAWLYPGDNPGSIYYPVDDYGRNIVSWGSPSCTAANFLYYDTGSNRNRFESGYFCNDRYTAGNFPKNNWYGVVSEYTGSATNQSKLFVNGGEIALTKFSSPYDTVGVSDSSVKIGFDYFGQARYYTGIIDEVRISNVARSADWIKFEYCNMTNTDAATCGASNNYERSFSGEQTKP